MGWVINGVPWTGAIKTVGSGKDYSTIDGAWANPGPTEDTLFLIYSGTYNVSTVPNTPHKMYFKGMGASYSDVVINGGVRCDNMQNTFVLEWVTFNSAIDYITAGGTANYIISKCYSSNTGSVLIGLSGTPTFIMRYCKTADAVVGWLVFGRGTPTAYNVSATYIQKTVNGCMWLLNNVAGALAESDYVATPTVGYGPDYGTDYIVYIIPTVYVDLVPSATSDDGSVDYQAEVP